MRKVTGSKFVSARRDSPVKYEGSCSGTHSNSRYQFFPKPVEWRVCYACGLKGHICDYCPNQQKVNRKIDRFHGQQPRILKRRSVLPVKKVAQPKNFHTNAKRVEPQVSKSTKPTPQVIKQSNVYHKQPFHKNGVWKVKTETKSVDNVIKLSNDAPPKSNGASTIPQGQWLELWMTDSAGKPKAVKAWVPNSN